MLKRKLIAVGVLCLLSVSSLSPAIAMDLKLSTLKSLRKIVDVSGSYFYVGLLLSEIVGSSLDSAIYRREAKKRDEEQRKLEAEIVPPPPPETVAGSAADAGTATSPPVQGSETSISEEKEPESEDK